MSRTTTTTPGDYADEKGNALYHPADERSDGGITDGFFLRDYRALHLRSGSTGYYTRAGIVEALSPDMDGYPKGGPVVRRVLASLVADDLPEHLLARPPYVSEGMDSFEPLSDADARDFMGAALYRLRDSLPKTRFVTGEQVNAMVDAYAVHREEVEQDARERAASRALKAKRATERIGFSSVPVTPFA